MSLTASAESVQRNASPDKGSGDARDTALVHLRTYLATADALVAQLDGSYAPVLVTSTDLSKDGPQILYANDAFLEMTGYDLDELLGMPTALLYGPDAGSEAVETLREELLQTGFAKAELPRYRKGGERFKSYITVSRMSDKAPGPGVFLFVEHEMDDAA